MLVINGQEYDATLDFKIKGGRHIAIITLDSTYENAKALFVDNLIWGKKHEGESPYIEDFSDYCLSGPITDNRDGTCSIEMGEKTDLEKLIELHYGGVN